MNDLKATVAGFIASLIGMNLMGFVQDTLSALFFGGIGALGAWLVNKIIKRYEARKKL